MSSITIESITPENAGRDDLDTSVKSSGETGGATSISVLAQFNGVNIGERAATIKGDKWASDIMGEFSPPGTLTIKATDPQGKVKPGEKSIEIK